MTTQEFSSELKYETAIHLFRVLLSKGLLTPDEYTIIDTKLRSDFAPIIGTLYPLKVPNYGQNDLINLENDGTMCHTENG